MDGSLVLRNPLVLTLGALLVRSHVCQFSSNQMPGPRDVYNKDGVGIDVPSSHGGSSIWAVLLKYTSLNRFQMFLVRSFGALLGTNTLM